MEQSQYNFLFSFIWNIANDVLVNAFNKGDYKKVILPMLVLRRIDVLLEPTKDAVIQMKEQLDKNKIENQAPVLYDITGFPFYNTSKFTMKTLKSEIDPLRLKMNFIEYLNGYSKDVLDIIEKLHLRQVVDNLTEAERLGSIIEKFTSDKINLSSKPVYDGEGKLLHPALDNHTVGMMFEELLRRFNEENNVTEAGEHFTPRDYVKLLADLAVLPVADKIKATTYSVYDGACGTGGIIAMPENDFYNTGIGTYIWIVTNGKEERRKGYVQLIDAFMEKEVLPYAPDAFYYADDVIVGYELSFTKYFYKPVELRSIADITTGINGIEDRLRGCLKIY